MRHVLIVLAGSLVVLFLSVSGFCAEKDQPENSWEQFSLSAGYFLAANNSSLWLGSGVGVTIDVEELIGLETSSQVFRVDGTWRFTDNRQHRLDLSWFAVRRSGSKVVSKDFVLEDPETGEPIVIPAGSEIDGNFDFDIYQLTYGYSFFQDDRLDIAALLGLYVMPIDVGYSVSGLVDESESASFTAPLPSVGLRMDIAITPKWFFRSSSQFFYLEYEQYTGGLLSFRGAIEYNPWEHVGLGVGFDTFKVSIEADGEDYPSIDFRGAIEYSYAGLQLYARVFF